MPLSRRDVIEIAKREVKDLFRDEYPVHVGLEEFRRGPGDTWLITIGFKLAGSAGQARVESELAQAQGVSRDPVGRLYRVVEIDSESGGVLGVTDRLLEAA